MWWRRIYRCECKYGPTWKCNYSNQPTNSVCLSYRNGAAVALLVRRSPSGRRTSHCQDPSLTVAWLFQPFGFPRIPWCELLFRGWIFAQCRKWCQCYYRSASHLSKWNLVLRAFDLSLMYMKIPLCWIIFNEQPRGTSNLVLHALWRLGAKGFKI